MFRVICLLVSLILTLQVLAAARPGQGVVVAMIGTGVQASHPVLGADKVRGGFDFVDGDADPSEPQAGLGTVLAAVVAASSPSYTGIAPGATLLVYRVKTVQQIAEAIDRAVIDGARVAVVGALGSPEPPDGPVQRAVDAAVARGVVVVAAAGSGFNVTGRFSAAGAAEKAITVGDDFHGGDRSSARGPTMVTMRFKPDVVADHVVQAIGDLPFVFGNDVSAARVGAMCAVLLQKHPHWTPLEIKSAITTSATAEPFLAPFECGSGKASLERAQAVSAFVNVTGLMFGMHPGPAGMVRVTRTVKIHNRAATTQTFTVRSESPWAIRQSVEPRSVEIPAGEWASVNLTLTLDYDALPYPDTLGMGGVLLLEGTSTLRVPWAFMRGARATVNYDLAMTWPVSVFNAIKGVDWVFPISPGRAEIWVKPGYYDFVIAEQMFQPPFDVRLVIAEKQLISGNDFVTLRRADATIPVKAEGVDERGVPFRSGRGGWHSRRLHIGIKDDDDWFLDSFLLLDSNVLVSPVSERVQFVAAEKFIESGDGRVYSLLHEPQHGIREAKTFVNSPDVYLRATIERGQHDIAQLCFDNGYVQARILAYPSCQSWPGTSVEFFAAGENEFVYQGLRYEDATFRTPMLRVFGGELVLADFRWWWIPDPMAPRVANGSTIRFGGGPVRAGLRVAGINAFSDGGGGGYYGALGEYFQASRSTTWTINRDWLIASGRFGDRLPYNALKEGAVYVETNAALRSVSEVQLGHADDWSVPSLPSISSIRTRDGSGAITDTLPFAGSASLEFAARNFLPFEWQPETAMRPDATRVAWRRSGSAVWQPLTAVLTGSEHGDPDELGHNPLGDIYRVELAPALLAAGAVDLRIEIEDANGTHTTWTQTAAFNVEPADPTRRRTVRK